MKESEYDFSERDIYLSVTIGCAGESELLNRYYEKSVDLTLEEIIKSVITTRLLLLNIDSDNIKKIIDETIEIANKIDIKEYKNNKRKSALSLARLHEKLNLRIV